MERKPDKIVTRVELETTYLDNSDHIIKWRIVEGNTVEIWYTDVYRMRSALNRINNTLIMVASGIAVDQNEANKRGLEIINDIVNDTL